MPIEEGDDESEEEEEEEDSAAERAREADEVRAAMAAVRKRAEGRPEARGLVD